MNLQQNFEKELNIKIMKLCGPFYCKICDGIVTEKLVITQKLILLTFQELILEIYF